MVTSFVIRCDVGTPIGMGHYYRCCLLTQTLKKNGVKAFLAIKFIDDNRKAALMLPHDICVEGDVLEEVKKYDFKNTNIILDSYHKYNIKNDFFQKYLLALKESKNRIGFIEGLGNESCPLEYYQYIDTLIAPYVMEGSPQKKKDIFHIFGKNYLLLDAKRIIQNKKIKESSKNILITFGGSDPHHQTLDILDILIKDERSQHLSIKVAVGYLMSAKDKETIQQIVALSPHQNISIQMGLDHLKTCFEWADLAITNTGQTRYELAASGVPFIIYPFDTMGYEVSMIFEKLGAAILEKFPIDFAVGEPIEAIFDLLGNYEKRLSMSINGIKNFFVPDGSDNLVKNLMKALS